MIYACILITSKKLILKNNSNIYHANRNLNNYHILESTNVCLLKNLG